MRLAISSIVFVAAFALVGCEKKVEAPAVADAAVPEKPACCEPAVDVDAVAPVAPLTAAPAPVVEAPAAAQTPVPATAPTAPVAAPTTTIKK
jgi:hypothetical protein